MFGSRPRRSGRRHRTTSFFEADIGSTSTTDDTGMTSVETCVETLSIGEFDDIPSMMSFCLGEDAQKELLRQKSTYHHLAYHSIILRYDLSVSGNSVKTESWQILVGAQLVGWYVVTQSPWRPGPLYS